MNINTSEIWDLLATGDLTDAQKVLDRFPEILNDYFKAHATLLRIQELAAELDGIAKHHQSMDARLVAAHAAVSIKEILEAA